MLNPRAALKALEELTSSKGWRVLDEVMRQEIVSAAMAIANTANMSQQEVDFRRGSIWCAHRLLDLPATLKARFETEIALTTDDRPDVPALNPSPTTKPRQGRAGE